VIRRSWIDDTIQAEEGDVATFRAERVGR
jgi:hypothetical protein